MADKMRYATLITVVLLGACATSVDTPSYSDREVPGWEEGAVTVSTDPSTVKLTSGQPQLIEFFAFW